MNLSTVGRREFVFAILVRNVTITKFTIKQKGCDALKYVATHTEPTRWAIEKENYYISNGRSFPENRGTIR